MPRFHFINTVQSKHIPACLHVVYFFFGWELGLGLPVQPAGGVSPAAGSGTQRLASGGSLARRVAR